MESLKGTSVSRTQRASVALFVALVLFSSVSASAQEPPTALLPEPGKPNIVYVVADDLSVAALERDMTYFPNVQELKARGVKFSNSFVSDPVCCPSRVTTMTGQYGHNHGVNMNNSLDYQNLEHRALPVWLDEAGYETGYFGKYVNHGYTSSAPGWDVLEADKLLGGDSPDTVVEGFGADGLNEHGETYVEANARKAATFVSDAAASGKPFFAYVSPFAPHQPPVYPREYDALWPNTVAPRTPSYNEADVSDKPHYVAARSLMSASQVANVDETYRDMLRSTKGVDDLLGTVTEAVEQAGELENTYVVFTSDNGFHYGQHRFGLGKWMPYEEDIRVPLLVSGPGVPAGEARSGFALNTDLAPTFAGWAGVETPGSVDGRSLEPLIAGGTEGWRNTFLVEAIRNNFASLTRPPFKAIRTERFTYVEYESGERELYDLDADPYQMRSIHRSASPNFKGELSSMLAALRSCSEDSCRTAENTPEPTLPPNRAPTIVPLGPANPTRDRTPLIAAAVRDDHTDLAESDIELFVDGREKTTFSYNGSTDRLSYTSGKLSFTWHTVKVVATDSALSTTKSWSFRVVR